MHGRRINVHYTVNRIHTVAYNSACMQTYLIKAANSMQLVLHVLANQSDPGPLTQHSLESKRKQSASAAEPSLEHKVSTDACLHS